MKLKILLMSLLITWGAGCVAYVQQPAGVQVRIVPPRTIVTVAHTAPVVRHVHVHRPHRVVRHVHRHTRTIVRHNHRHRHRATNNRNQRHSRRATNNRNQRRHRHHPRH